MKSLMLKSFEIRWKSLGIQEFFKSFFLEIILLHIKILRRSTNLDGSESESPTPRGLTQATFNAAGHELN